MGLKRYSVAFAEYEGVEVKAVSAAKAKAKLWRMYDDAYPNSVTFFSFVRHCYVLHLGPVAEDERK
jgi:hypothetical protein